MTLLTRLARTAVPLLVIGALGAVHAGENDRVASPGPAMPAAVDYHVSPQGDDSNPGTRAAAPFRTIAKALAAARPGQRISLAPGEYFEDVRSVRAGAPDRPIWLTGTRAAVVKGAGDARVVELRHSHIVLSGFAVDGEVRDAKAETRYRDKLVYLFGRDRDGITGVRLLGLELRNAGGECVRMKYFARRNEVAHSTIRRCGIRDFELGRGGKNGEGIYIGTAPEQLDRNPTSERDASNGNWIHHNRVDTRGNECVDVKEGASFNLVEHNECTGQLDADAAGISFRGSRNVARHNVVRGNRGAGIRFGGDTASDGVGNDAYGNWLSDNAVAAFKVMRKPQGRVCANRLGPGSPKAVSGKFASAVEPDAPCPGG